MARSRLLRLFIALMSIKVSLLLFSAISRIDTIALYSSQLSQHTEKKFKSKESGKISIFKGSKSSMAAATTYVNSLNPQVQFSELSSETDEIINVNLPNFKKNASLKEK